MRAIVLPRYGSPADLELRDIPRPEPGPGEVLVRVRATAVNDWDWGYVRGEPRPVRLFMGLRGPRTAVLGAELAGTVEAVGSGVTRFRPGDDVYGDTSEAGFGGFAEYAAVSETALAPKPAAMTFEQAACVPHAGVLALQGLRDLGGLRSGERVLINGAGGGVGTLGVQLARHLGAAEVTGVDSAAKADTMRGAGFDHVLDYRAVDFTATGERYDLVLDTKTNRPPHRYLGALAPGGRYITVGGALPRLLQVFVLGPVLGAMNGRRIRVLGLAPNRGLEELNRMFEERGFSFVIDGPHPLEDVPRQIQRFGDAGHLGKIVISVAT